MGKLYSKSIYSHLVVKIGRISPLGSCRKLVQVQTLLLKTTTIAKIIRFKIIVCDPKRGAKLGKYRARIQDDEKDASKIV